MKPWKLEDLAALGPNAIKQLEAQGVVFDTPEEIEKIGFRNPVRAVPINGSNAFDIGGGKGEIYQGKCIDMWYDNHAMTSGWVKYQIPFLEPKGDIIVTTQMSNIVRR